MAVTNVNKIIGDITYPVARKSLRSSLVVLFTSARCGLAIVGDDIYNEGRWETDWVNAYDTGAWEAVEVTING